MTSRRRFSDDGRSAPHDTALTDSTDSKPYGRVTAPERFAVLHTLGDTTLQRLADVYAVERVEGPPADPELTLVQGIVRIVRLTPVTGAGAPLTVGFSAFPGLVVRAGRWFQAAFPECGCDACEENPLEVEAGFTALVTAVVTGQFQEGVDLPWIGSAWLTHAYGDADGALGRRAGRQVIPRRTARAYLRAKRSEGAWGPWVARLAQTV